MNKKEEVILQLTIEAKTLLLATNTKEADGIIINIPVMQGKPIKIGKQEFGAIEGREMALWNSAFDELINYGLIQRTDSKGTVFGLTKSGWDISDELKKEE